MDKKTYEAEYLCVNCGTPMIVLVDFGKSMPFFTNDEYQIRNGYGYKSPPCKYCGCDYWRHGRKPQK